jgi:hypothetical protein
MRRGGRTLRAAALLSLASLSSATMAGRPLDTDDAVIIPSGSCQIETFTRRVHADPGPGAAQDYGFAPTCNPFGLGELMLAANRYGVGPGRSVSEGAFQYKDVPFTLSRTHPGLGYNVGYATDFVRGLRRSVGRVATATVVSSVAPFDHWQFDANLGWLRQWPSASHRDRDHLYAGIAAEWTLSPRLTVVAERVGATRLGHSLQAGLAFVVSPRVTLDAAAGRRYAPDGRANFATIGLTWVSRSGVITPE